MGKYKHLLFILYQDSGTGAQIGSKKVSYRIIDLAVTKDGKKLIVLGHLKNINILNVEALETPGITLTSMEHLTSFTMSVCGRYLACSVANDDEKGTGVCTVLTY